MLILFHSVLRWLLLASLLYSLIRACRGLFRQSEFTKTDNALRHWTATIAHIQMMIGITIFVQSPLVQYFWEHFSEARKSSDALFFGLIHIVMMLTSVVVVTIGSALTKRRNTNAEKFSTMLRWFSVALIIILLAIPWPFSPLVSRPYFRSF
jgi:hypothetical protein